MISIHPDQTSKGSYEICQIKEYFQLFQHMLQDSRKRWILIYFKEYVHVLTTTAKIKKNENPNVGRDMEQPELLYFASRNVK